VRETHTENEKTIEREREGKVFPEKEIVKHKFCFSLSSFLYSSSRGNNEYFVAF